jgi:hypothetical protein
MRTIHHTIQASRAQTRMPLQGWHGLVVDSDAGAVSVFTARKINPCGDPGGLLKERKP